MNAYIVVFVGDLNDVSGRVEGGGEDGVGEVESVEVQVGTHQLHHLVPPVQAAIRLYNHLYHTAFTAPITMVADPGEVDTDLSGVGTDLNGVGTDLSGVGTDPGGVVTDPGVVGTDPGGVVMGEVVTDPGGVVTGPGGVVTNPV